jgi:glycosyltransferase involved in cell wall biosynthesis
MIEMFAKDGASLLFELFVFGDGSYAEELKTVASKHPEIHYFGRQNLATIKRYIPNCKYCLMPSTFLETFGLTALTALSR